MAEAESPINGLEHDAMSRIGLNTWSGINGEPSHSDSILTHPTPDPVAPVRHIAKADRPTIAAGTPAIDMMEVPQSPVMTCDE